MLYGPLHLWSIIFFFFTDTAPTEIYTLSLHDALPIFDRQKETKCRLNPRNCRQKLPVKLILVCFTNEDSSIRSEETRLNSSHVEISYAVFCLKKKKKPKKARAQQEQYPKFQKLLRRKK